MTTITVLMPAFNAARYIAAAVDSVLAQTHRDSRLLAVRSTTGSTDGTADIVLSARGRPPCSAPPPPAQSRSGPSAQPRPRRVPHRPGRPARCRRHDDPDRLALQVKVFADPSSGALRHGPPPNRPGGHHAARGLPTAHARRLSRVAMLSGNHVNHSAAMYRADAVRAAGGYRPEWFPVEDYDLWLRLIGMGRFVGIAGVGVVTVNDSHGVCRCSTAAEQARLHRLRTDIYVRETHGAGLRHDLDGLLSTDDGNLRSVRAVAGVRRQPPRRPGRPWVADDRGRR